MCQLPPLYCGSNLFLFNRQLPGKPVQVILVCVGRRAIIKPSLEIPVLLNLTLDKHLKETEVLGEFVQHSAFSGRSPTTLQWFGQMRK